ncbi:WXG100 family type VII secretion target [Mycobacterium sp. ML4]
MSDGQSWNFGSIDAGASSIQGAVKQAAGLLDRGKQALNELSAAWGGSGSEAYQAVQQRWDGASQELNDSLESLAQRISEASQAMLLTESRVTAMFQ